MKFLTTRGAIKLHVGLDHDGYLPTFMQITDGKVREVNMTRSLDLPKGSMVVFDRGYMNCEWYNILKNNIKYLLPGRRRTPVTPSNSRKIYGTEVGCDINLSE